MTTQEFEELLPSFIAGVKEALEFTIEEEHSSDYDDASSLLLENGCRLFLNKSHYLYELENAKRCENGQPEKAFSDYAHDFFFTSFSHGVGYWEVSVDDWLYVNDSLTKYATSMFHVGISAYCEDGKIYIG